MNTFSIRYLAMVMYVYVFYFSIVICSFSTQFGQLIQLLQSCMMTSHSQLSLIPRPTWERSYSQLGVPIIMLVSEPDPLQWRRKGLGMCPHSSGPYGMQVCMVISDLWRHNMHVHCQSARCSPQLSYSTRVKQNSTAICRI